MVAMSGGSRFEIPGVAGGVGRSGIVLGTNLTSHRQVHGEPSSLNRGSHPLNMHGHRRQVLTWAFRKLGCEVSTDRQGHQSSHASE
jgi:hypothetical protein